MKLSGAIFDLDGTLADSMDWWESVWDSLSLALFDGKPCRPNRETEEKMHTMVITECAKLLHAYYAREWNREIGADVLLQVMYGDLGEFYATRVTMKAGMRELVEHLYSLGIPMCIASASERENILIALRHFGIEHCFSRVFTCTEVGRGKRFPDIYEAALQYLGTPKETTWVFEDTYTAICTAKAFGLPTVGIYEAQESHYEEMKQAATVYIDKGESPKRLIPLIKA